MDKQLSFSSTQVIQRLKDEQDQKLSTGSTEGKKLTHKQVRNLIKKERRKNKRRAAAVAIRLQREKGDQSTIPGDDDDSDDDDINRIVELTSSSSSTSHPDQGPKGLITRQEWLEREGKIKEANRLSEKKRIAAEKAQEVSKKKLSNNSQRDGAS